MRILKYLFLSDTGAYGYLYTHEQCLEFGRPATQSEQYSEYA